MTEIAAPIPSSASPSSSAVAPVDSSATAWLCTGHGETVRVTTPLVRLYYNDNYDDGGRRSELTLQRDGHIERYTLGGDFRDRMREGTPYTFVLRPHTWYGSTTLRLVEVLDGAQAIYRYENRYRVDSKVVLDQARGEIELESGGKSTRLVVPSDVLHLPLDPAKVYSLSLHDREHEGASCRRLEAIGEQDPARTVEMFDEMLGPYEVPAIRVLWSAGEPGR